MPTMNETAVDFGQMIFGWLDYTLFILLLGVSIIIGVYFGFFKKQNNTMDYFLGGKRMNYWPIAMSILASHISGMTLLGVPTEVYHYGSQYFAVILTTTFTGFITIFIFLPVFYKLQLPSTFGYLEMRFARSVRLLCSLLYIISLLIYIPIVVYVPALAFSQVTGFSIHALTPILCIVCITYTTIGGLKAVVWTDTIQLALTCTGLIVVLIVGIKSAGGILQVVKIADEGGRLIFFDMNPDPFVRNSFWAMTIGMTFHFVGHISVNQGVIQRFLSVPTQQDAKISMILMCSGMIVIKIITTVLGLVIYVHYSQCDPLMTKAIKRSDEIFPFYVMDVAGHIPGLPGLFLAGLVSSALSTMSASLNTLSGSIYEDFIDPWLAVGASKDRKAANIMKVLVVVIGAVSVGLVFVVEHLGTIFQMGISMRAMVDGPLLGLFVLGMMVPWVKTRGALFGATCSLAVMVWITVGTQWYKSQGKIPSCTLPSSVDGCPYPTLNETAVISMNSCELAVDRAPIIYSLSFLYYTLLGLIIAIIMAIIGSLLFKEFDISSVNPDHITPLMKRFVKNRQKYVEVPMKRVFTE